MGIDANYSAKTFYTLESLKLLVETKMEFGRKSQEKLLVDIMDYRRRYIGKLKKALYDYTALAVFGEMRHGVFNSTHYNPSVPESEDRRGAYGKAKQFNPTSILIAGEKLFLKGDWAGSIGGEKWRVICNRVLLMDKIDDGVYCDMCFSLTHNCSPYLDKYQSDIFQINDRGGYKHLLDYKFRAEDPQDVIQYCLPHLGTEIKRLLKRAKVLGFLPSIYGNLRKGSTESTHAELYIFNYKPIEWANEWLNNDAIMHREHLGSIPMSVFPDCIRSKDDVDEGEIVEIRYDKPSGYSKVKKGMLVKVVGKRDGSLEVVFEEDIDGYDLRGKCKNGHGLSLHLQYFKKLIA